MVMRSPFSGPWFLIGLLLPILTGAVVAYLSPRRRTAFVAGAALGMGFVSTSLFQFHLVAVSANSVVSSIFLVGIGALLLCGLTTAACSLTALVVTTQEQLGRSCPSCMYPIHETAQTYRCPECGELANDLLSREEDTRRFVAWVNRWSPYALLLTGVLAAVVLAIEATPRFQSRTEFQRFCEQIGGQRCSSHFFESERARPPFSASVAIPSDPSKLLLVVYDPDSRHDQPPMQIRLQWVIQMPTGYPPAFGDGNPAILCNLDRDQAQRVLRDGIPASLHDSLIAAANDAGWSVSPYARAGVGRTVVGSWVPVPPVCVPPPADLTDASEGH
ncbi:MAG: hypothetical protein HKN07_08175 [Acidimicrobiia bacterium]|nr:hypothetical protein [Acidimicrobiia bacterium]